MTEPDASAPAPQSRERHDPEEKYRPLPWFISMLISAMAMWGAFYIHDMQSGLGSQYGDSRTRSVLMPPASASDASAGATAALDGGAIFAARCVACHQTTGLGIAGVFPPLAGSEWVLGDVKTLVLIPLHGIVGSVQVKGATYVGAMPVFSALSDAEIAAVLTYVRSQWGNAAPPVTAAIVAAGREATKARTDPWASGDEIKAAGGY